MNTYTQRVSTPALPDLVGEVLDARYEVLEHVADGGMAVVYKALDTRLDREVALKVLKPHLVHDEEFVRRFEREARAAASLQHANIVGVLDYGRDRGHLFIVLEYVAGRTLRQIIDDEGSLTPRAALDLMDPVLDALGQAHRAGLIHRDVKPENVLVREDGVVKVADFGLVRAVTSQTVTSSSSVLLGTVAYVSPEQVARGIADARSDVYSAGLILFELLTGTKAFTGELPVNVAFMHVHEDAPRVSSRAAGTPTALDDAVATAASRDPDARPADALAFRSLLARVRAGLTAAQLDRRLGPSGPRSSADTRGAVGPAASTAALPVAGRAQTTASIPTASSALATTPPSAVARRRRRWPWVLVALSAALLAAKSGLFAVRAQVFLDCTGDGDLATWAGAPFEKGDAEGALMPGTLCSVWADVDWAAAEKGGRLRDDSRLEEAFRDKLFTHEDRHLPGMWRLGRDLGGGNIGHTFGLDGTDERSITAALLWARKSLLEYERYYKKYLKGFEQMDLVATAAQLGVRETRRILGDYVLCLDDFKKRAVFPDEIGRYNYAVDVHAGASCGGLR